MATEAYTGNPNIARQGARARQIAQARNVSDIADPRTYGFMQGLLGSAPDQLGYSVFDDPETRRAAQQAAEVGLVGGGLLQSIPVLGPALKGYGRLAAGQVNRAMMGEGGLLGPITPQPMYVVPPSIAGGKNPIQSAVVLIGDKIFTGRTHGDALNRAVYEGAVRKEGGKYIFPKGAEINSDLFMTNSGQIIDRLQASKMFDIGASETAIEKGLMQNKPSGSMTIDQYMEQAQQIKKQREQPSFQYPQQAALDLAQQRAALPVEQGGLGLPASNTPEMRAKAMGFDLNENLYHGTEGDFPAFQKSPKFNTYATEDPEIADIYAMSERRSNNAGPNIIPLVARGKKLKVSDYDEANPENYSGGWFGNNIALRLGIPWQRNLTKRLPAYGYDRLEVNDMADLGGIQTQHMFPEPEVLRSRFAAFDPFRKDVATATAMGVALPDLLAAEPTPQPQSSGLLYPFP